MSAELSGNTRTWTTPETRRDDGARPVTTFGPGEVIAERFKIVRLLGQGGMGQVFEAEDLELGAAVALKVIRPELARRRHAIERFKREVHLARQVTHTNVCRVFDLFQHNASARSWGRERRSILLLTMELVPGETLAERLKRSGPLSPDEALPLVRDMARALDAAHGAGVVHRDFKSSNVLLAEDGSRTIRLVVTDFGLAQAAADPHSDRGHAAGTPAYMAPEVAAGAEATAASDVYSFGLVIYEMLTGALPFPAEKPPDARRPELAASWEAALLRCLEFRPERRFRRAGEVVEALAAEGSPMAGKPLAEGPRPGRPRPLLAAALASTVLGLLFAVSAPTVPPAEAPLDDEPLPSVALLGFQDRDAAVDNDWLSTVLVEMLALDLGAGGQLRMIPAADVDRLREELAIDPTGIVDPGALVEAGRNLDADFVLAGSFQGPDPGDGGRIRVDVRLVDTSNGETHASFTEENSEAEVRTLTSGIAARLSESLGFGSPAAPQGLSAGLPTEPEAIRLYASGMRRLRRLELDEARDDLTKAARIDPRSPRTHAALAETWAALGRSGRAQSAARRALDLALDLPRKDRLAIEGCYREINGDGPRAREIYEELWDALPAEAEHGRRLAMAQSRGGRFAEALVTLERVRLQTDPADAEAGLRTDLFEARIAQARGDVDRQHRAAARAAAAAEAWKAPALLAEARWLEAEALNGMGLREKAQEAARQARQISEGRGDRWRIARALVDLSYSLRAVHAERVGLGMSYDEALAVFRDLGDRRNTARVLVLLTRDSDEEVESLKMLSEALALAREIGDRGAEAEALGARAALAFTVEDDQTGAIELLEEAATAARDSGNLLLVAGHFSNLAGHIQQIGSTHAKRLFDEAVAAARQAGSTPVLSFVLCRSGRFLHHAVGDLDAAARRHGEALDLAARIGDARLQALASMALGEVSLDRARWHQARLFFEASVRHWQEFGLPNPGESLRAASAWIGEDPSTAEAVLRELARESDLTDTPYPQQVLIAQELTRALIEQRRLEEARQTLDRFLTSAAWSEASYFDRLHALALAARAGLAPQRLREAYGALERVPEEAKVIKYVGQGFRSRLDRGWIHLALGDVAASRAGLETLVEEAGVRGFTAVAQEASELMRHLAAKRRGDRFG